MRLDRDRESQYLEHGIYSASIALDDDLASEFLESSWPGPPAVLIIAIDRDVSETESDPNAATEHPIERRGWVSWGNGLTDTDNLLTLPELHGFRWFGQVFPRDTASSYERIELTREDDARAWRQAIQEVTEGHEQATARFEQHHEPTGGLVEVMVMLVGAGAGMAAATAVKDATSRLLERVLDDHRRRKYSQLSERVDEVRHKAHVEASLAADVSACLTRVHRHPTEPWIVEFVDRESRYEIARVSVDLHGSDIVANLLMSEGD